MQIFTMLTPQDCKMATKLHTRFAHVAYTIDRTGQLACDSHADIRGGLMVLGDLSTTLPDAENLIGRIEHTCLLRNFCGVLADFDMPPSEEKKAFLERLGSGLRRSGRCLFVPEHCAVPSAYILLCTALSGGTLQTRMCDFTERYGVGRCALDMQRLSMDFTLPCRSGEGSAITPARARALQKQYDAAVFYSPELCVQYFSYCEQDTAHIVLYDDAMTLHRKRSMGEQMGIRFGFFVYPEICDLVSDGFL